MLRYTFSKSEMLLAHWEFVKVYNQGTKKTGKHLIIYVLKDQPSRKIGISTPKKIGNAVIRNRARRLIRETFRLNKHKLANDIHLVVTTKPSIKGLGYKEVEKHFLELIEVKQ